MNTTVSITRRVNKRHYPVVFSSKNGSIKPGVVLDGGVEKRLPGGNFYISWYMGRKPTRISVGADPERALSERRKREQALARGENLVVKPIAKPEPAPDRETLAGAVQRYLDDIRAEIKRKTKDPKTLASYSTSCCYLLEFAPTACLADVTAQLMLEFSGFLRDEKELSDRSVYNRFTAAMIFLKWTGHIVRIPRGKRPTFAEEEVEIFEDDELERFFAACTAKEHLLYKFLLQSGFRDGEVMHFARTDISKSSSTVKVKAKPQYNWHPKKGLERSVPVPASLIDELLATPSTGVLVFPRKDGQPDNSLYEKLRGIAKRAGLEPDRFWLHKFRATYATTMIRSGKVDLFTLAKWMGHKNTKTLERYVRAVGGMDAQTKVEAVWADR
jgi:integrase/recombinase XerD